jgi:acetoin utilization deacetylase AcuC-like enzyme
MRIVYSVHHKQHPGEQPIPGYHWTYEEAPARAEVILEALTAAGLGTVVTPADHGLAPILAVHDAAFVAYLQTAHGQAHELQPLIAETFAGRGWRRRPRSVHGLAGYYVFDYSAPILEGTWTAAYWSAQVAATAADLVRNGERCVYALCRPPGHHAAADLHGGFCYLNNAAIAARALQNGGAVRVAIVDIDYHHGNGTQEIFYHDPTVLFCSLHADPDHDYPFFWGGADELGEGAGAGYNRNWPLPHGADDAAYLAALDQAVDVVRGFAPDYLVISAGFDLMAGDPITPRGGFAITVDGLRQIGERLAGLALPTVVVQEGGYNVPSLGMYAWTLLRPFAAARAP